MGGGPEREITEEFTGVSVKPIEFRKVMNRLLEEWNGPRQIESRDVGPYRCLVTFSSAEIRDNAMNDEILLSVFDKVRPIWDFTGSLSRRVWIEIIGLPIELWCEENIRKITELWGKTIVVDDRTEESKSFSVARVLLDSFEWEKIHEWVSIRVDDRVIEVFVKEFGSEIFSVESHPNREVVSETYGGTPLEAESENGGVGNEAFAAKLNALVSHELHDKRGGYCNELDPAYYEAQLTSFKLIDDRRGSEKYADGAKGSGPCAVMGVDGTDSDGSCPFPPGFGLCTDQAHIHHLLGRVQGLPNLAVNTHLFDSDGVRQTQSVCKSSKGGSAAAVDVEEEHSDETLYKINENFLRGTLEEDNRTINGDVEFSCIPKEGNECDEEEEVSDTAGVGGEYANGDDVNENCRTDIGGGINISIELGKFDQSTLRKEDFRAAETDVEKKIVRDNAQWDSGSEELSDEDLSTEVVVAREVWNLGGLSFGSSDEEEVLGRLTNRRRGGKKYSKSQKQSWNPTCLQGRTLATRTLRSGSKLWP
ncbi:hypothetical protein PIB30_018760 [Stylosanthes scabra]|uniref:DUF4283 domain-containing protein n=1 Tax=Stylosanthes scabra TaxID=79078 RepID=A0ABU6Z7L3_9FABA|nr:hypothetical protein [Stylosanthes scabra]